MTPEDLLADLPPIRDDEPSSLRQDIADELADHLQCAAHRELVKSGAPEEVEQRVLERFGDPRAVARNLWWLAMWSRIMSQRALLGFSLAGNVAAVLISAAVFWQFSREREGLVQGQQAQAAQLTDLMSHLRGVQRELAQMRTTLEQQPPPPLAEPTLKIRLMTTNAPAKRQVQSEVRIYGQDIKNQQVEKTATANSLPQEFDFGKVVAGPYMVTVRVGHYERTEEIRLKDGDDITSVILCPDSGVMEHPLLAYHLPEDLQQRGTVLLADYDLRPIEVNGATWHRTSAVDVRIPGRTRSYLTLIGAPLPDRLDEIAYQDSRKIWPERSLDWDSETAELAAWRNGTILFSLRSLVSGYGRLDRTFSSVSYGARLQLARLIFIDNIRPTTEPPATGKPHVLPLEDHPAVIMSAAELARFPQLLQPFSLGDTPVELTLPPELLQDVRDSFEHAYAANAERPANTQQGERRSRGGSFGRPRNLPSRD